MARRIVDPLTAEVRLPRKENETQEETWDRHCRELQADPEKTSFESTISNPAKAKRILKEAKRVMGGAGAE